MHAFADFALQLTYPPNPVRNIDNSLTPQQQAGRDFFFTGLASALGPCEACHRLDPSANPGEGRFAGFFGADGRASFAAEPQVLKVPHLRNLYQKVGMFGSGATNGAQGPDPFLGAQIRGFGFNHDGTDSNLAPIVGQQITLTAARRAVVAARIDLLLARADAGECQVVAKGRAGDQELGFLYLGGGWFRSDRQAVPAIPDDLLRAIATRGGAALTYTCVPPGSGVRIGIDRDHSTRAGRRCQPTPPAPSRTTRRIAPSARSAASSTASGWR